MSNGRNTWQTNYWNGNSWILDTPIIRPNADTSIDYISTQTKIMLADGSKGFMTPEILYNTEDITFQFLQIYPTDYFYTQLINYVKNGTLLQITTHLNEVITGKFTSMTRIWLSGVDDTFDFQVIFQRTD